MKDSKLLLTRLKSFDAATLHWNRFESSTLNGLESVRISLSQIQARLQFEVLRTFQESDDQTLAP